MLHLQNRQKFKNFGLWKKKQEENFCFWIKPIKCQYNSIPLQYIDMFISLNSWPSSAIVHTFFFFFRLDSWKTCFHYQRTVLFQTHFSPLHHLEVFRSSLRTCSWRVSSFVCGDWGLRNTQALCDRTCHDGIRESHPWGWLRIVKWVSVL